MTTTTKTTKAANGKDAIGDGWDDAPRAAGEAEHPAWVPHWSTFKDEVITQKMTTVPEGSTADPVLVGTLHVARAFGEPRYFVDKADATGKVTRMALPLHGTLTSALDSMRLEPAPTVRLQFNGEAKRARPGERAAFVYDVRCKPREALLPQPREDALLPVHRANKEARDAKKAKGAKAIDDADATE